MMLGNQRIYRIIKYLLVISTTVYLSPSSSFLVLSLLRPVIDITEQSFPIFSRELLKPPSFWLIFQDLFRNSGRADPVNVFFAVSSLLLYEFCYLWNL
jgi:hypothetical protein